MKKPIIFVIAYTPYKPNRSATAEQIAEHKELRAFYDMSGAKNAFDYLNTEGKRVGKFTHLEYLQKNTGVFDGNGFISKEQVEEMKERARRNKGNIWHGFISLSEEDSHHIDTPEKCMGLIKETFYAFLKEAKFNTDNIDLMCALHLDKPEHLHIHFVFWEKEPTYKAKDNTLRYRSKGKISEDAIARMKVRLGLFFENDKDKLYRTRDEAIMQLKRMTFAKRAMSYDDVKKEVISLAHDLPNDGRLSYGSKDMEPFRDRVDKIVRMLILADSKTARANSQFILAVHERKKAIEKICKQNPDIGTKYINTIENINSDYKRRLGNLVIKLAKFIKPEFYERPKGKNKANRVWLKRRVGMSKKKMNYYFKQFVNAFVKDVDDATKEYKQKAKETEEEIEKLKEEHKKEGDYKG